MDSITILALLYSISFWMCLDKAYCYDCDDHLVSDLPSQAFNSSSQLSTSHGPGFAKLNRRDGAGGWSPVESNRPQWLQIDLGERTEVTAVATQGRYGSSDWVTSYALMFSDSENNWKQYRQQDSIWTFLGNSNADTVIHHNLQDSVKARFLRLVPLAWNPNGRIGMRVEVYGCLYKSDVADFDGRSSLLYRFSQKTVSTVKDTISLQFRSMESEGVILHGEGQRGDYITLELNKGKLSLQINLAGASKGLIPAPVVLGSLLDDQHWHYITIERNKNQVNFTVDKDIRHFYTEGSADAMDIDYGLSFGGISVPGKSKSFLRKNFRGCLENIYYNGVNIIDLAKRRKPQIHILGNVSFSCWEAAVIPVTFGGLGSYLVLPGRPQMDGLSLSFQFRTWNGDGLLLYSQLPGTAGALRIRISRGKLGVTVRNSSPIPADNTAGLGLNDGQWHTVNIKSHANRLTVILNSDRNSAVHLSTASHVRSGSHYWFGGCPDSHSPGCSTPSGNFQGCMQLFSIDNQLVDLGLVQRGLQGNFSQLQMDSCRILDRCLPNYCEHGGECSQSWNNFYCDCTGTGYTGETCHNSVYKQSCETYKHTGNTSGFFYIDPDGSGSQGALLVYCNMTEDKTWTIIQHNDTGKTSLRGSPHTAHFAYAADSHQLQNIINSVEHCEQELEYHCRNSHLQLTPGEPPLTWWIGRTNEKQTYWGGAFPGAQQCGCGLDRSCLDPHHGCNCDADRDQWAEDTRLLSYKDHLPVTKLVVGGDLTRSNSEVVYRLGPLRCYGDRSYWNAAAFSSGSSYLHFPTFRGELSADISFFFKTTASSGVFLENLGIKDFIRLQLNSPTEVLFSFDVGNGPEHLAVKTASRLNDNQWHYVTAERNVKEASLQVDNHPRLARPAPTDGHIHLHLSSQLFVGGTASRQRGFLGCMRAMRLNGESLDLEERATVTPGVTAGCPGHCSSYGNLCHNGGRCTERPNGYSCDCSQSPYNGPFCKAEVSALLEARTTVVYNLRRTRGMASNTSSRLSAIHSDMSLARESVRLSFRTVRAPGLLLYADSQTQEYVAAILNSEGRLQIRYRLDNEKDPDVFTTETGNLADGHVHSFKMDREGRELYIQIDRYPAENFNLSSGKDTEFNEVKSLILGKIVDIDGLDAEVRKANAHGFVGCLSSVQFDGVSPLKAALGSPGSKPVTVTGNLQESNCHPSAVNRQRPGSTIHPLTDHGGGIGGEGRPLNNAKRGDSAIIGGVIALVIFVTLCVLGVMSHLFYQHKGSSRSDETKPGQRPEPGETTAKGSSHHHDTVSDGTKEYFI